MFHLNGKCTQAKQCEPLPYPPHVTVCLVLTLWPYGQFCLNWMYLYTCMNPYCSDVLSNSLPGNMVSSDFLTVDMLTRTLAICQEKGVQCNYKHQHAFHNVTTLLR
jgi:hypothetical protein